MRHTLFAMLALLLAADAAPGQSSPPDVQQVLTSSADEGKFTFIVFYRDAGPTTQAMFKTLKTSRAADGNEATIVQAQAASPANQALVKRYGVGRAPMPLTVAVAPNGAVTGVFASKVTNQQVDSAFVTPKLAQCIKSMQSGRLVVVFVSQTPDEPLPPAVEQFCSDPQYSQKTDVVSFPVDDANETAFLKQLKIDPATLRTSTTALLAPPAVLIGKFGPTAKGSEMAAALHAAGKCCNDPNCKHNHSGASAKKPAGTAR